MELTPDLRLLIYTALLAFSIPFVYLIGRVTTPGGMAWGLGNRDGSVTLPAWAKRGERAHANLTENLAPFAILVLVAHVSGAANETTALGARIFFWARVAHAAVYIIGVPYLRTLVFFAGVAGEVIILTQLF
ncbi:MAG: MAPEG family protein [Haliangiales bacterium]